MSIALDLALLLRNSSSKFGLSLAARSILNALAFRVGTKANTWINQQTLAKELGITIRALRKHHESIEASNILYIKTNSRDKRKYLYSFNSIFFNYHQMKKEDRIIVHTKLKDIYDERDIKVKFTEQNRGTKVPVSGENRGTKVPLNRGTKVPLVSTEQIPAALELRGLEVTEQILKETYENNIKDKDTKKHCSVEAELEGFQKIYFLYRRKQNGKVAKEVWLKKGLNKHYDQIEKHIRERNETEWKNKDQSHIPLLSTFLNGERWNDEIIKSGNSHTFSKNAPHGRSVTHLFHKKGGLI